jgi:hypothetical protein
MSVFLQLAGPGIDTSSRLRSAVSASVATAHHTAITQLGGPDNPEQRPVMPHVPLSDDELVAQLLIHTWTLTTGKMLRSDVPPQELTEQELINFWADDHFEPAGRPSACDQSPPQPLAGAKNCKSVPLPCDSQSAEVSGRGAP